MATRSGLFDGSLLSLFPRALSNTSLSPSILNHTRYATRIENIIPNTNKAGSGAKRYGIGAISDAVTGESCKELFEFRRSNGELEILAYFSDGTLRRVNSDETLTTIKSGLDDTGTLFGAQYNGKLILVNGIDNNFSYNGSTCEDLSEYVVDYSSSGSIGMGSSPTWISSSSFRITVGSGRTDYATGTNIKVTFASAGEVSATVVTASYNIGTGVCTITVSGTPFPSTTQAISRVEYETSPPPFSFIFTAKDLLWALSGGTLSPKTFRGADGMLVYHTNIANNENSWFNETTQEVSYTNVKNKAGVFDELVAISEVEGYMVFHGREQTQLWQGDDPNTVGSFAHAKTLPVGTAHGKLVMHLPGDVMMFTKYGVRSVGRAIQTENMEIQSDIGADIDPTITEKVSSLMQSTDGYRKARSFYYARDGFYGFKADDVGLLVYFISENTKGWATFTGHFADATAFLGCSDGRLLVGRGEKVYAYANGTDVGVGTSYSDDGQAISCVWESPWISKGIRWSNRAWEVIIENGSPTTFYIDRFVDYNTTQAQTIQFDIVFTGSEWDVTPWDTGLWDSQSTNPVSEDKFLVDAFMFRLRYSSTTGPLDVLGVKPIGR